MMLMVTCDFDSNLRDIPALIYISCRKPEGPKAERGPKPRFNLGSGLSSWPLRRLFDLCSGRITHLLLQICADQSALYSMLIQGKARPSRS